LQTARISKSNSCVKLSPELNAEASSEVLYGETVSLLEEMGDWYKVSTMLDGYEGFIDKSACELTDVSATHWVSVRSSSVFASPNIKSPVVKRLVFRSLLSVSETCDDFYKLDSGGYLWAAHCQEISKPLQSTMINIAEDNYLNSPYVWGGRSTDGCDCSGLVQMLALATGNVLPRDSGDQEQALQTNIAFENRRAEDLVFWPGHVGVLKSPDTLLHATAHSMNCCHEPLQNVIDRAGPPRSIKRIT